MASAQSERAHGGVWSVSFSVTWESECCTDSLGQLPTGLARIRNTWFCKRSWWSSIVQRRGRGLESRDRCWCRSTSLLSMTWTRSTSSRHWSQWAHPITCYDRVYGVYDFAPLFAQHSNHSMRFSRPFQFCFQVCQSIERSPSYWSYFPSIPNFNKIDY